MIKVYFITSQSLIKLERRKILFITQLSFLREQVKKTKGFAMLPKQIPNSWTQANKVYATLG